MPASVKLYRYDLTQGMAAQMSPMLLGRRIEAVWHTAIVVFSREFYFDGGVGIVQDVPGATRFGRPLRIDDLGTTTKTEANFIHWVQEMRRTTYGPNDYNLLQRNCNHFSQDAAMFLTGRGIGEDVRTMIDTLLATPLGAMVKPMLESMTHSPSAALSSNTASVPTRPNRQRQLTADELDTLQLQLALVESSLDGEHHMQRRDCLGVCLTTLQSVAANVLNDPARDTYRRLKCSSNAYEGKLLGGPHQMRDVLEPLVVCVLETMGFRMEAANWVMDEVSVDVISAVRDELRVAADRLSAVLPHPTEARAVRQPEALLAWWGPPGDLDQSAVGSEAGEPLFSIRVNHTYLGKGTMRGGVVSGHFLSHPHDELLVDGIAASSMKEHGAHPQRDAIEVLHLKTKPLQLRSVTAADSCLAMVWLPLWLIQKAEGHKNMSYIVRVDTAPVARASFGSGVHPAVVFRRRGNAVQEEDPRQWVAVIPYGGCGVEVTGLAEILCVYRHVPQELIAEALVVDHDRELHERKRRRECAAIRSIDDLVSWVPDANRAAQHSVNAVSHAWQPPPTRSRALRRASGELNTTIDAALPQLLLCHDFRGGYRRADAPLFVAAASAADAAVINASVLADAYTVQSWEHVDVFVYFSHERVTVPPRDWIACGHCHGVPVLGTFITEWEHGRSEWLSLLTNPNRMGVAIAKLIDVAVHFGFDGYLVNVENEIAAQHVQRLLAFVTFLRDGLKARIGKHARVVWYDAVTTEGKLTFQNTLNARNRPFFDASDAIFLNYFWHPQQLPASLQTCGARSTDVFVGVDVFGRSMAVGGGFKTDAAVAAVSTAAAGAVDKRRLSVALFAPGWTLENASGGTREGFLSADATFWGSLATESGCALPCHVPAVERRRAVALHTDFSKGSGTHFSWRGEVRSHGAWVQRSSQPTTTLSGLRCAGPDGKEAINLRAYIMGDPTMTSVYVPVRSGDPGAFIGDTFVCVPLHATSPSDDLRIVLLEFVGEVPKTDAKGYQLSFVWRYADATADTTDSVSLVLADGTSEPQTALLQVQSTSQSAMPGGWLRTVVAVSADRLRALTSLELRVPQMCRATSLDIGSIAWWAEDAHLKCLDDVARPEAVLLRYGASATDRTVVIRWSGDSSETQQQLLRCFVVCTLSLGVPSSSADGKQETSIAVYMGEHELPVTSNPYSIEVDVQMCNGAASEWSVACVELLDPIHLTSRKLWSPHDNE